MTKLKMISGNASCGQDWSVEDIAYPSIEKEEVRGQSHLFYLLASASFVEITSGLYASSLVEFFRGDSEVTRWIEEAWQHEEIQHGIALKRYVNSVWPEFDWDRAYRSFYAEYSRCCERKRLGPTPALEMASRCLVETGTATMYTMLCRISAEPVLRALAARVRGDEVRHYKHFYRYFTRCRERERLGQMAVFRMLWNRVAEIDDEDAYCAFKHVFLELRGQKTFDAGEYVRFRRHYLSLARDHYPYRMAAKMFLKPLELHGRMRRLAVPLLSVGARLYCAIPLA